MALLHKKMGSAILELVKASAKTGEPVLRHMEYNFPNQGYADIKDQFMMGKNILVAPVQENGKYSRKVVFPKGTWKGTWKGDDGSTVTGPVEKEIKVPLERLPWYRRAL